MAYRRTEQIRQRLAARHAALLAAARALAAEQGINAVQIVPLARRAGVAAGTVYRYFPSKPALIEALVGVVAEAELGAMQSAAAQAPGPLSGLAAAILTLGARALRQRTLIWALTAEPGDADTYAPRAGFRRALSAEVSARIEAAALGDTDPVLGGPAVVAALLEGLTHPGAAVPVNEGAAQDAVRRLALFCLRGLGVVDGRARGLVIHAPWPEE
jgi:AcrR family transcriptional regulator